MKTIGLDRGPNWNGCNWVDEWCAGQRYLVGAREGWQFQLFVRARKGDVYRACGPVLLESAEGNRPMTIIWRLARPLTASLFREFSVLRGA